MTSSNPDTVRLTSRSLMRRGRGSSLTRRSRGAGGALEGECVDRVGAVRERGTADRGQRIHQGHGVCGVGAVGDVEYS